MNPYTAQRLAQERITKFRAEAAQRNPGASATRTIRHRTGWALIQIGLALVTSSARRQHRTMSPDLP
jgi:molybdopterin synthase catalytic subunit